ncbi:all-trans retinoic acid-induced differentiation factor [Gadus morhua]|uniref:All-trans retinoic acid-induced differentiation factor n=1 Tax=Gadus morhua TaxID=8049 RepID=A0A8C5F7W0_GADMO|nr:all-trans retinoic acid-induced differentiation factor [Gadus morhua]
MKAGCLQPRPAVVVFVINLIIHTSCHLADLQICHTCNGTLLNDTVVGRFCSSSDGRVEGRCCFQNLNSSTTVHVIGLDLSNCSLDQIDDLQDASTAVVIDLSGNPIVNISDFVFQGCSALNEILLPTNLLCPGGNASWESIAVSEGSVICRGQKSMCNETRHMTLFCPENSCCAPNGPGFFSCRCIDGYHGYKCRREGEFPFIQVFAPIGVGMVMLSILLWVVQRRKVKTN